MLTDRTAVRFPVATARAPLDAARTRTIALASALALVLSLPAGGCAAFKSWAYSGGDRDEWQKPEQVLGALALESGDTVADLGAGGGYFTFRLADRVGPEGRVYAVDVDEDMLELIEERAAEEGHGNVEVVRAAPDDPKLPRPVDLVFTVNTYHHLGDRTAYFRDVRRYLEPGGRVAVIDLESGFFVRLFGHTTPPETIRQEMEAAGYRLVAQPEFLERQSYQIFTASAP